MDTLRILKELRRVKNFLGVFPRDMLPHKIDKYPSFLVINTDKSYEKGEHWIAIHFRKDKIAEYFDSFGIEPYYGSVIKFLFLNSEAYVHNKVPFQHAFSNACGWYAILYIKLRSCGYSFCEVISIFSKNSVLNDSITKFIATKIQCKGYRKVGLFEYKSYRCKRTCNNKLLE